MRAATATGETASHSFYLTILDADVWVLDHVAIVGESSKNGRGCRLKAFNRPDRKERPQSSQTEKARTSLFATLCGISSAF
jgi:hypothetical protein